MFLLAHGTVNYLNISQNIFPGFEVCGFLLVGVSFCMFKNYIYIYLVFLFIIYFILFYFLYFLYLFIYLLLLVVVFYFNKCIIIYLFIYLVLSCLWDGAYKRTLAVNR